MVNKRGWWKGMSLTRIVLSIIFIVLIIGIYTFPAQIGSNAITGFAVVGEELGIAPIEDGPEEIEFIEEPERGIIEIPIEEEPIDIPIEAPQEPEEVIEEVLEPEVKEELVEKQDLTITIYSEGKEAEYDVEYNDPTTSYYPDLLVDEIHFENLREGGVIEFEELELTQTQKEEGYVNMFSFDIQEIETDTITFSSTAGGDTLFKCQNWQNNECLEWQGLRSTNPRENYIQSLGRGLNVFAEWQDLAKTQNTLETAAAYNITHADGAIVYGQLTINNPYYRLWNDTLDFWAEQTDIPTVAGDTKWVVLEAAPTRDELMLGIIQDAQEIHIFTYNGTGWSSDLSVSSGVPNAAYRSYDLAYEQTSGDALIVYENSNGNDGLLAYRTWNGTDYTAEQTYDTGMAAASFNWFELVERDDSNDIMVLGLSSANDLYAIPWNGTDLVSSLATTLNTGISSASEFHFDFGWEASSGQGLAVYAVGDLTYRTYDPVGGWGGTENTISTGAVDAVNVCDEPGGNGDHIGFIWQDSQNDVSVRMWDGSSVLGSPPSEDANTEANGANNKPVDCAFVNSTTAIFGFIDRDALAIDYVTFTKANTWSSSALTTSSTSANFAGDDIKGLEFTKHPSKNEFMVVSYDIAETASTTRWTGSAFSAPTTSQVETSTEITNGAQQGGSFAYYFYDSAPTVTNLNPNGEAFTSGDTIQINATVTDNLQMDTVLANITYPNGSITQLTLLNGSIAFATYNSTFSATTLTGTYTIRIIANDTNGNVDSATTSTFVIPDGVPFVTIVTPTATSNYSRISSNQTFNASIQDLGIDQVIFMFDNASGADFNVTATNGSGHWVAEYNVSTLAEGIHTITVFANDTNNGVNNTESITITTDYTAPTTSYVSPTASANFSVRSSNQTFNVSIFELNYPDTTYFMFDNASGTAFNVTATNQSGHWAASYNVSTLAEGSHIVTLYTNDTVGNVNNTVTQSFTTDYTNPAVTWVVPTTGSAYSLISSNQTFNVSILELNYPDTTYFMFDNASGTAFNVTATNQSGHWAAEYNVSTLAEGSHIVTLYINDTVGNTNNTESITFTVDNTVPAVTIVSPLTGSNFSVRSSNQTFNASILEISSDIAYFMFDNASGTAFNVTATNQSGHWAAAYNVSTLAEGIHTITAFANDTLGNVNKTETITITTDYTNPAVTIQSPLTGSIFSLSSSNQTFNASILELNYIDTTYFMFDNASGADFNVTAINQSGNWSISYNISSLAQGAHIVTLFTNDSVGNANNTESILFTMDSFPPNVTSIVPSNGSVFNISNSLEIAATINDVTFIDSTFANLTYPNGTTLLLTLTNSTANPAKFNVSFTVPAAIGLYNITFIANDTSNNRNTSEIIFITINDSAVPAVTILTPTAGQNFAQNANVSVTVQVTDDLALSQVLGNFTLPNGTILQKTLTDPNTDNIFNVTFNDTNATGVYTLRILANDTSNNRNWTQTRIFNILDTGTPIVTLISPLDTTYNSSNNIIFTCNATDSGGLDNVTLYHNASGTFAVNETNQTVSGVLNQTRFTTAIADGHYLWNCLAYDTAGNSAFAGANFTLFVDTQVPAATNIVSTPTSPIYNNGSSTQIEVNFTSSEYPINITFNLYYLNGTLANTSSTTTLSAFTDLPINFTVPSTLSDANLTLNFTLSDNAGNTNTSSVGTIVVDSTFPTPSNITSTPTSPIYNNGSLENVSVNFSSSEYPVNLTFNLYYLNGTLANTTGPIMIGSQNALPYGYLIPSDLSDANLTLNFTLSDNAGNTNTSTVGTIVVDSTFPTSSNITSVPTSPIYNNGSLENVSVNFSSSEYPVNLTFNLYYLNGTLANTTGPIILGSQSALPYGYLIPSDLSDANLTLNFTLSDSAGNTNTSTVGTIVVDTIAPILTGFIPTNASTENASSTIEIAVNVSDASPLTTTLVNLTYPNGTITQLTLVSSLGTKYNTSFSIGSATGTYNLLFLINDTTNNLNSTQSITFTVSDSGGPILNIGTCTRSIFNLTQSTVCNATISDNVGVDIATVNITLPNGSIQGQTVTNVSSTYNFTFTNSVLVGNHTVTWRVNDTNNNFKTNLTSFIVNETTAPTITLNSPANGSNSSLTTVNFSITAQDNYYSSFSCSIYINGTVNSTNSTVLNNTVSIFSISGFTNGDHSWYTQCSDNSSNVNTSVTRVFTVDTLNPTFNSFTTTPSSTADLDPNKNITIKANITDNITAISQVIFQYKLSNQTNYTNLTMVYNPLTLLFNRSFNATQNGTYNLRFWANDSSGNSDTSSISNISVELDRTWIRSPVTFTTIATNANLNVTLGNLTINNTGDFALHFNISSDSNYTHFNDSTLFNLSDISTINFTLEAGAVRVLSVNDTSPAAGVKAVSLNISTNSSLTSPISLSTTGSIVVAPGQPVLSLVFTTPSGDTRTVTQGDTGIPFIADIENIGEGNATNVTSSFVLPSGWDVTFGAANKTHDDDDMVTGSGAIDHSIEVSIPSNTAAGDYTILINATGLNLSGTSLQSLGYVFTDSVTVTVQAATTTITSSSAGSSSSSSSTSGGSALSSGGGGSGSGGGSGGAIQTIAIPKGVYHITRGTKEIIPVTITNLDEFTTLNDVGMVLTGFLSEYITIKPDTLSGIGYLESKDFTLEISVPSYLSLGTYDLSAEIRGWLISEYPTITGFQGKSLTQTREFVLQVEEASQEDISDQVNFSRRLINAMVGAEFFTQGVEELYQDALRALEKGEYTLAQEYLREIEQLHDASFEANTILLDVQQSITEAQEKWLKTPQTQDVLNLALLAFERGEYATALERAKNAQLTYVLETKNKVNIVRFLMLYWWQSIVAFIAGLLILFFLYRKLRVIVLDQRIKNLNKEEKTIEKLLITVQKRYLKEGTLTEQQFELYVEQYQKRLTKVRQLRVTLRNKRVVILKTSKELALLTKEKGQVRALLRKTQRNYFVAGKINRERFMDDSDMHKTRLSEIEHEESILKEKMARRTKKKLLREKGSLFWTLYGLFKSRRAQKKERKRKAKRKKVSSGAKRRKRSRATKSRKMRKGSKKKVHKPKGRGKKS